MAPSAPGKPTSINACAHANQGKHLVFVYEAGPCGYWLYRYLSGIAMPPRRVTAGSVGRRLRAQPHAEEVEQDAEHRQRRGGE